MNKPIIALDYDGTVTLNVEMWLKIIQTFQQSGFLVYVVTMRYASECRHPSYGMDERILKMVDQVFFTSREAKKPFMQAMKIPVSIWIDDTPEALLYPATIAFGSSSKEGDVIDPSVTNTVK